jgi:hypothetical protein
LYEAQAKEGNSPMTDADSYVCLFCAGDIRSSDERTTVPNLGVLVHSGCYRKETESPEGENESDGEATAA